MINNFLRFFFLLLILSVFYVSADVSRPGNKNTPTEVRIAKYVVDLDNVSSADQNFTVNVLVEARWKDPRLKHNSTGPITKEIKEIWHPGLQFVNQQRIWDTIDKIATISPDGTVTLTQRVWGDFSQPLSLHNFPFDKQCFNIQIVPVRYSFDEVKLVQNPELQSGMAEKFSVADWEILGFKAGSFKYSPFRNEKYPFLNHL